MAWCDKQFEQWNKDLQLTVEQAARVTSAFDHFAAFCDQHESVKKVLAEKPFYQGSAATRTIIRPLRGAEFDVDIVFPLSILNLGKHESQAVMSWFKSQVNLDEFYKKNRIEKDRCVRIDYAGEFHVDFIPATEEIQQHQPFAIPAKDLGDWTCTDPLGFKNWVLIVDGKSAFVDKNGDGAFIRSIRYVKRWRDQMFDAKVAPSSMLLVTMMGLHDPSRHDYFPVLKDPLYPEYKHDAAYLYDMMRLTHSCLLLARESSTANPMDPSEDLGRDWNAPDRDHYIKTLGASCDKMREAIYSKSESDAVQLFKAALGDTFPG